MAKYLFRVNHKDTRTTSMNSRAVWTNFSNRILICTYCHWTLEMFHQKQNLGSEISISIKNTSYYTITFFEVLWRKTFFSHETRASCMRDQGSFTTFYKNVSGKCSILYILNIPENLPFSGVLKGYIIGTQAKNRFSIVKSRSHRKVVWLHQAWEWSG